MDWPNRRFFYQTITIDNVKISFIEHVRQIAMGITKRDEMRKDNIKGKNRTSSIFVSYPIPYILLICNILAGVGVSSD